MIPEIKTVYNWVYIIFFLGHPLGLLLSAFSVQFVLKLFVYICLLFSSSKFAVLPLFIFIPTFDFFPPFSVDISTAIFSSLSMLFTSLSSCSQTMGHDPRQAVAVTSGLQN